MAFLGAEFRSWIAPEKKFTAWHISSRGCKSVRTLMGISYFQKCTTNSIHCLSKKNKLQPFLLHFLHISTPYQTSPPPPNPQGHTDLSLTFPTSLSALSSFHCILTVLPPFPNNPSTNISVSLWEEAKVSHAWPLEWKTLQSEVSKLAFLFLYNLSLLVLSGKWKLTENNTENLTILNMYNVLTCNSCVCYSTFISELLHYANVPQK